MLNPPPHRQKKAGWADRRRSHRAAYRDRSRRASNPPRQRRPRWQKSPGLLSPSSSDITISEDVKWQMSQGLLFPLATNMPTPPPRRQNLRRNSPVLLYPGSPDITISYGVNGRSQRALNVRCFRPHAPRFFSGPPAVVLCCFPIHCLIIAMILKGPYPPAPIFFTGICCGGFVFSPVVWLVGVLVAKPQGEHMKKAKKKIENWPWGGGAHCGPPLWPSR